MNQKDRDAAKEYAGWDEFIPELKYTPSVQRDRLREKEANFLAGCTFKEKQILELLRSEE